MVAIQGVPGQSRLHKLGLVLRRLHRGPVRTQVHRRLILHCDFDLVAVLGEDGQLAGEILPAQMLAGIGIREHPVRGIGFADGLQDHPATDEAISIRGSRRRGHGREVPLQGFRHIDPGILLLRRRLDGDGAHHEREQEVFNGFSHHFSVLRGSTWSCRCPGRTRRGTACCRPRKRAPVPPRYQVQI